MQRFEETVAFKAFENTNLFKTFQIDLQKIFNFFHEIETGYRDLPYHNRVHASDVLHACYFLTTHWVPAYADYPDAIHDHDHPGRNNAFLVATRDPKAITYNDRSVLENHHISSAWKVLMREENFFVENLSTIRKGEFQGDEEIRRGHPVSDFMDRRTCNVAELQSSFMNHVVSPLLNALVQAELLPIDEQTGRCELLENFAENLQHWRLTAENGSTDPNSLFNQGDAVDKDATTYAPDVHIS
ncbi:PDEase I domain containing protein [Trichuris trichiura]|uniref:PDEase I domain containing protein n=1 Tax=Trichuris trichiura TaxID=36087 RepID=A0A077ZN70_TRITR|nr:PDEase I domain containing protein [Trichuris trichiura]